ncbi:hypothetical protein SK128_025276 [Halocaridina rubra]|uniref:Speckle targeted PIP5K1A-regulated poly(A) polymerase n=1 Tax=Halocaridina rubra TaxID=373956 RepID=A0AAN8X9G7_HALRR
MTMAGDIRKVQSVSCTVCKSGPMEKTAYICHILGKRHQKNVRMLKSTNKGMRLSEAKRTLYITGYDLKTPVETLIGLFWKYGILCVSHHGRYTFVELLNSEYIKGALGEQHFIGTTRLKVSLRMHKNIVAESSLIHTSVALKAALNTSFMSLQSQWRTINMLVNEIELKISDYGCREYLRRDIEQYLKPHFPSVVGHIFGSSANNLGFVGCDVDLYVHLGVAPWGGSRAEKEKKASDLTWYIARTLRQSRVGMQVQAISRARVPIVKFVHASTKLHVDLSFRNEMPVYNTQLICQYTRSHVLVRPYLMVIRYWAKLQGVAGGGQPTYLITNYGLTMMMLFYLMVRPRALVPSVAQLKSQCPDDCQGMHTIAGWDCNFGQNLSEWSNRKYSISVMDLVHEFFSYYANLDTKNWIISPLAGHLLGKEDVIQRNMQNLPACMWTYCQQETDIQTDTAMCVQDPFEHCFNITRGLHEGPLAEFQYKCKIAAEISEDIVRGRKPLGHLFDEIYLDEDNLNEIHGCAVSEVAVTQEEIITLDDSDEVSQDEIEILDSSGGKMVEKGVSMASTSRKLDSEVNGQIRIVEKQILEKTVGMYCEEVNSQDLNTDYKCSDSDVQIIYVKKFESTPIANGACDSRTPEGNSILPEYLPDKKSFKFFLDFSTFREFSISLEGKILGGKVLMRSEDEFGQAASSLVHFILQQCLKFDLSRAEFLSMGKTMKSEDSEGIKTGKRKSDDYDDAETAKRLKDADGDSVRVLMPYRKIAQFMCADKLHLYIGRKKISKSVPLLGNPLENEMTITEAQIANGVSDMSRVLNFVVTVWQKTESPFKILVTGDSKSDEKMTKSLMVPLFQHLASFTLGLLKKTHNFIISTSAK